MSDLSDISIPPDALAQSYLRQANLDGTGALVIFSFKTPGPQSKNVVHLVSNRDDKTTQGLLAWVNKIDDRVAEVAARALAAADNLTWDSVSEADRHNYTQTARVAIEAARVEGPKTLNIIKAS